MNLIIISIALIPLIIYLLTRIWEWSNNRTVYNIKTGEIIKGLSIWDMYLYFASGSDRLYFQDWAHSQVGYYDIYSTYFGPMFFLNTTNHKFASQILQDTTTFAKFSPNFMPSAMKRIFGNKNVVSANGEDWHRQRKPMNSAFYSVDVYLNDFKEKASLIIDSIRDTSKSQQGIIPNISKYMQQMTLDVLGKTIFGHEFNSIKGSLDKYLTAYNFIINSMFSVKTLIFGKLLEMIPGDPVFSKFAHSCDVLDELFYKMIESAKKKLQTPNGSKRSMLEFMVQANQDEDQEMTDQELRDNIMVFFLAGHETTSIALSYAIYLLASNPSIQDKLRKEVTMNIGDQEITYESVNKCEYLLGFIKESMRVFPPLTNIPQKLATKDTQLGDWFIPKGTRIGIDLYTIHHSKELYGDPENVRPERWSREEQAKHKIPASAWLPFSAGSRVCLGNIFSLLEQKVFLIELVRNFQLENLSKMKIRPEKGFGLSTPRKMDIRFIPLK